MKGKPGGRLKRRHRADVPATEGRSHEALLAQPVSRGLAANLGYPLRMGDMSSEPFREPQYEPLSSHEVFRRWTAARAWSTGTVAFGAVVDDLVSGIAEFAGRPRRNSHRRWQIPAAVGCVPWMNNEYMTAALASMGATCIVMDKGAGDRRAAEVLLAKGSPMPISYLPGFDDMARPAPRVPAK